VLKILQISQLFRIRKYIKKRRLIIRGSLVRAQLGPQFRERELDQIGFDSFFWIENGVEGLIRLGIK
jgi:hypothetical protein